MRRRIGPLRSVVLCFVLQIGVFSGVPMRPDEIQKLMRSLSKPAVAEALPEEGQKGDGRDGGDGR